MNSAYSLVFVLGSILLGSQLPAGQASPVQETTRYRMYSLDSTLDAVVAASGARAAEVRTLHERPAHIQELQWRAPYLNSKTTLADPVREIVFTFYNDALYQIVVNYDRDRTEGLTNSEVIESISTAYGAPEPATSKTRSASPPEALPDSIVLARWDRPESTLTLVRGEYGPEFQLILVSKALGTRARSAIREAIRLDAVEAPRREADQRKKEAGQAIAARDKTRETNKAAFRP